MKHVACNLCGADSPEFLFQVPDGRRMNRCAECGFVYVNPVPDADELYAAHEESYYETIDGGYEGLLEKKRAEWRQLFEELAQHTQKGPLLEVGCAKGFCSAMARDLGWSPLGIDISKNDVEYARKKHGLEVIHGTLPEAGLETDRFNVVVMWSVIEHLHNPQQVLDEAFRVLRPGGVISVTTCNVESRAAREAGAEWIYYVLPGHLCFFSPATLRLMLTQSGFDIAAYTGGVEFSSKTMNAAKRAAKSVLGKVLPPGLAVRVKNAAARAAASGRDPDSLAGENFIVYAKKPVD